MSFVARLYYDHAGDEQSEFFLNEGATIIGRDAPADILLLSPQISRRHARINCINKVYTLTDLDSTNGTFLNGEDVGLEPALLKPGDEIFLGGAITLHFDEMPDPERISDSGRVEGIWIDPDTKTIWLDASPIDPPLQARQYDLLKLLYDADGATVTRDEIVASAWPDYDPLAVSEAAIDSFIQRLHKRLSETQPNRDYLDVLPGNHLRIVPSIQITLSD